MEDLLIAGASVVVYPIAIWLLPAKYATKLNIVLEVAGKIIEEINQASKTKGGFTHERDYDVK
jgi:hypothetical protein